jgi:hypothetical protein
MANVLAACIACGNFIEGSDVNGFISQGGRCATCQGERKLAGKFGSLLVEGVMTQRELAQLKREFYQLYQIDKALEERKAEFMRKAQEEMERVVAEVEAQAGTPLKALRDRKKQLEAQLKTFMEESSTSEMRIRDLLVELRDAVVNRGNMPQYTQIVEDLRQILKWSEEEMETFVRAHYSQPVTAPVMTVKPLPPGSRKGPTPGKPVASRYIVGSIAGDILAAHQAAGGGTFNMEGQNLSGQPLYAVSLYPDRTQRLSRDITEQDIDRFLAANQDLLADPRNKLGTWRDSSTGENYLDVVVAIPDQRRAMELGKRYNQKAIYDLKTLAEINTGGTGAPVSDMPEPARRLDAPSFGDEGYAQPSRVEKGGVLAYHTLNLDLPTMAVIHTDFIASKSAICKVTTPEDVFILTGERVRENGLYQMITLQARTKATLKVADVEQLPDDTMHVLVEGTCAYDPNTLRSFLAERLEGYEITETYYETPERVAVELKPVEKIAADPMASAMAFFNSMFETLNTLIGIERNRGQAAEMILGQTTAAAGATQVQRPDNNDELALKWERANVGGDTFGAGTQADGGIMGPNDRPQA